MSDIDIKNEENIADVAGEQGEEKIEDLFQALDSTIKQMEKDDVSLEDTFSCYEKGIRLVGRINAKIDKIEKEVMILSGGEEQ